VSRILAILPVLFALIASTASPARADTLKVVIPELPPFGFMDADKKPSGLYTELTELVAGKAGIPITLSILPLPRAYAGLEDGSFDVLTLLATPKTDELAEKIVKLLTFDNVVIGAKGTSFAGLEALKGKTIANLRGMTYDARFNGDEAIRKIESNSYEMNINLLKAGRVDGMVGPQPGLVWQMKKMGLQPTDFGTPLVLNTASVYLHYSKKKANADVAAKLAAAAAALDAEKGFDAILAKYTR
jgi:polar amino acid transport system substrate-binding protein